MTKELLNQFFGDHLRGLRKAAAMSQKEVSHKANITPQELSGYENGKCIPNTYRMMRLAGALGVSMDVLLGLGGQKRGRKENKNA